MNVSIRKANHSDLPQLRQLVAVCMAALRAAGIDQWDKSNPSVETIQTDVAADAVEVLVENAEIVGCVTLDRTIDPLWKNWDGAPRANPR